MILIIGLGNPGKKYLNTRHNIGFRIIDEFAKENNFSDFTPLEVANKKNRAFKPLTGFRLVKKFDALISENNINNIKVILAKPQTFMNNSGAAVKKITTNYKLQTTNIVIIHDDIDLPLGKIRVSQDRGSAGHKGVESIIKELGAKNFTRLRIGIRPEQLILSAEKFVLQKFTENEEEILKNIIKEAVETLENLIENGN